MQSTPMLLHLKPWTLGMVIAGALLAFTVSTISAQSESDQQPPNIIVILIDDLGWMDLHCQGNEAVETPHLDRLASQGMRFTNAYAAAPVCSPSRAAILTGRSPAQLDITNHIPDREDFVPEDSKWLPAVMKDRLDLEHLTIAEILKAEGYATAFIGKWHLAGRGDPNFYPEHQGFDLNVGGCAFGGPPTFFDPYGIPTIENRKEGEYLPDRLADEAIAFMRKNSEQPFLLCLWNYTVHWPMEAPDELLQKYKSHQGPGLNDYRYGAMIEAMDRSIGRVIKAVDEMGKGDNTLIIFTSDNGGYGGVSDCRPLRESKGYLYEGGIRVPMIARWTGQIEAGSVCNEPVVGMDLFPTLLSAAGSDHQLDNQCEGVDLLPMLKGNASLDRDAIFFHYPNFAFHRSNRLGSAVRSGKFKLIENLDDQSLELYDLDKDLSEENNLAEEMPEMANDLREKLHSWRSRVDAKMPRKR